MARPLKLIQITDLHLHADPDATPHGWHVNRAWRRIRNDAMTRHPDADLWVLSGDLVDDESVSGYQRLDEDLAWPACPVLALAGNHDDPAAMRRHLTRAHVHTAIRLGGWQLHALDSHVAGRDAGRLGAAQLDRLRGELDATPGPAVVFVHHPPIILGSRWLDAIGLHDRDALCRLIRTRPQVAAVVCGHAHQALATHIGHAACWTTPSTMRQFLPGAATFALDRGAQPGYRVIQLTAAGHAQSRVQRVAPPCG